MVLSLKMGSWTAGCPEIITKVAPTLAEKVEAISYRDFSVWCKSLLGETLHQATQL